MRDALADLDASGRRGLADFLLDKCHIVLISATGIDRAHRMFTVLNATGRPLARNDILKASLLGSVPAPALEPSTAAWDAAQARLGADFDGLFSHIRIMFQRSSTHIISGVQKIAQEQGGADAFITRLLAPAAEAFDDIRHAMHDGAPQSAAISASLRHLGWLRGGDWIPPALLCWLKRGTDPAELAWFLRALDRLAYGLRILGMGTKRRAGRLGSVISALHQGESRAPSATTCATCTPAAPRWPSWCCSGSTRKWRAGRRSCRPTTLRWSTFCRASRPPTAAGASGSRTRPSAGAAPSRSAIWC
jgi:hypothetical protein